MKSFFSHSVYSSFNPPHGYIRSAIVVFFRIQINALFLRLGLIIGNFLPQKMKKNDKGLAPIERILKFSS